MREAIGGRGGAGGMMSKIVGGMPCYSSGVEHIL